MLTIELVVQLTRIAAWSITAQRKKHSVTTQAKQNFFRKLFRIEYAYKGVTTVRRKRFLFVHGSKRVVFFPYTSSHDKTRSYLKRGSDILTSNVLARVRIWVISTVTAPNKHISCKSCSSRTRPSVTATMIVFMLFVPNNTTSRPC